MSEKFTPGPWSVEETVGQTVEISSNSKTIIADIMGLSTDEGVLADANLIAASPDLYALCEYTLAALTTGELVFTQPDDPEKLKRYVVFVGKLEGAIQKATGGTNA